MFFTLENVQQTFSVMYVTMGQIMSFLLGLNLGFVNGRSSPYHDIHLIPRKHYYKYLGSVCDHILGVLCCNFLLFINA
jgi:hypothetical protein